MIIKGSFFKNKGCFLNQERKEAKPMKNVLVTFDLWKEGQEILEKGLGPLAKISYLKMATDRSLAIKEANILFS